MTNAHPNFQFIYPLLVLLMEFMTDIHHLAVAKTFDMKEWISPFLGFTYLETEISDHLDGLKRECIRSVYNAFVVHMPCPLLPRAFQREPKPKQR